MHKITGNDREILRRVARKQQEHANSARMQDIKKRWLAHNTFTGDGAPMVHIEIDTFEQEIIPSYLQCKDEAAREIEKILYRGFLNAELFLDDFVVNDYFPLGWDMDFLPCSLTVAQHNAENSVGFRFEPQLENLNRDKVKLKPYKPVVNREKTNQLKEMIQDAIGDILPVKLVGEAHFIVPTYLVVGWMGMENMLYSMYDYPEDFHQMMRMLTDEYLGYFDFMEKEGLILPTAGSEKLAQGSWCFTNELPDKGTGLTVKQNWGYLNSQEMVGVSPDMFAEFVFPYYKQIADRFGLLSYGCCEPVDAIWESCISRFENLRKVSISAWCNEEFMGDQLRGANIIYHRKPSANFIGVGQELDEAATQAHIDTTLKAAKGCHIEFTQRDVYSIGHNVGKVKRYVEMIRARSEKLL